LPPSSRRHGVRGHAADASGHAVVRPFQRDCRRHGHSHGLKRSLASLSFWLLAPLAFPDSAGHFPLFGYRLGDRFRRRVERQHHFRVLPLSGEDPVRARPRQHPRVAWLYLRSSDAPGAAERMCAGIRRFANHHGATGKYHHTLTLFWMRMVGIALVETAEDGGFVEFLAEHPELCGKNLPATYYSQDLLQTGAAREGWVEPDLQPLPNLRVYRCC